MMAKQRLDILLVERGLVETREKAKRTVMAGLVFSNEQRLDKPGMKIDTGLPLRVKGAAIPYVGRGGLKLEKAIAEFKIDLTDRVMIDVGSSTGGFTDCALQNGASYVYAVDVGYNQLAWKLRTDDRVNVMERVNFRHATKSMFAGETPNFASIDVSFISLKLMLPVLTEILAVNSEIVALVKPQFEAGRDQVGKKGIVRDPEIHLSVLEKIYDFSKSLGFIISGVTYSPITGGDGNIEFLLHLRWETEESDAVDHASLSEVVQIAHTDLK